MERNTLQLPHISQEKKETIFAQFTPKDSGRLMDAAFFLDQPQIHKHPDGTEHQLCGKYQLLHFDSNGLMQSETGKWEQTMQSEADAQLCVYLSGNPEASGAELMVESVLVEQVDLPGVCALTLTDQDKQQAQRPSLILRKKGEDSLWQVAKETGSTVERILQANGLDAEPPADQMLLIPV
jgi:hypothetical protein